MIGIEQLDTDTRLGKTYLLHRATYIRNTLNCHQCGVYFSRFIFSSISPNLPFHSFSLYRRSASNPPPWKDQDCVLWFHVRQPEPETNLSISVNLSNNVILILCYEDAGKEAQCACVRQPHLTWLNLNWIELTCNISVQSPVMCVSSHYSVRRQFMAWIEMHWIGLDKYIKWSRSCVAVWNFPKVSVGPEVGRWSLGRQYSYFLHWSHILLFRYVRDVAREE